MVSLTFIDLLYSFTVFVSVIVSVIGLVFHSYISSTVAYCLAENRIAGLCSSLVLPLELTQKHGQPSKTTVLGMALSVMTVL